MSRNLTCVLGAQWGDEGKGKLVDIMSENFDYVARATGGANAGHTVVVKDKKYVFHLIPSGILHKKPICVIGNGVAFHVPTFLEELKKLDEAGIDHSGRLKLSERLSLLFEFHKMIDGIQEESKGDKKVGTTKRGIGPCYSDKINRQGLRLCDLKNWDLFEEKYLHNLATHKKMFGFEYDPAPELTHLKEVQGQLLEMMVDGTLLLNEALDSGRSVLVEGANAALLDIDHGTYPFVTSSSPTIGGVFTGTGMNAKHLGEVIGIVKAYMTRVGSGPFPTELLDQLGDKIREAGGEYGSTTGRPRRCGWFDVPLTKYSILLNGFTSLNLTKLDVLDDLDEIQIATEYRLHNEVLRSFPARLEDLAEVTVKYETLPGWKQSLNEVTAWEELPENAKNYVLRLEELLSCQIQTIGVGRRRDQLITRK